MQRLIDHVPSSVERRAPGFITSDLDEVWTTHGWVSRKDMENLGYRQITDQHGVRIWQSPCRYHQGQSVYRAVSDETADMHAQWREKGME